MTQSEEQPQIPELRAEGEKEDESDEMNLFKTVTTCVDGAAGPILAPTQWGRLEQEDKITSAVRWKSQGPLLVGVYCPPHLYVQGPRFSDDRHIVQILDQKETTVYATILAIPNFRLKSTDKTVITFRERPAGQPEALRAWFYPGRQWGEEFVYPKAKAIELAKLTNTPVLFTPAELPLEVATPIKTADEPVVAELRRVPIMAITPKGEEVQLAEVVTPPPPETLVASAPMERTLPETASRLPLIGLLGLLALGGALAVRSFAKRLY